MDPNRIDEIAEQLDDIVTTLEELKEDCSGRAETFDRVRLSIEKAVDAIDRLENRTAEISVRASPSIRRPSGAR